ncbi:MIT domain protein [Rhizoctonia solani AG-3 Rhs1AP]|uniref:MIT domain protein n=2 Tax=Rhizoctonia solani AG-3 TaxID=1086053 RepID=A0A074RUC7_9AGAM|nr:MIT domain protein [Rhizoctonia solani AG-3 Rhs1AP]KEP50701.1 MIT domain protein [Rhizoctonia solani 123E]
MPLRFCRRQILQLLAFLSCGVLGSARSSCSARRAMKQRSSENPPLLEKHNGTRRMSRRPTLLNALEHANRAVALDTAGSVSEATEEYNRTIELLEGVLQGIGEDSSDNEESVRITKIRDSYRNRTHLLISICESRS